ncbi:Ubiquitin-conjugating enzyme E2 D1 [Linum grandiflorum]
MAVFSGLKLFRTSTKSSIKKSRKTSPEKRINKEIKRARDQDIPSHCSFGLAEDDDDIFKLQGAIFGPAQTPYEGGVFFLSIHIPKSYPYIPPKIKFITKVYHPNVRGDGRIEVDILGNNWTPVFTIEKLLLSICSLLPDPDPDAHSPLNPAAALYLSDLKSFNRKARDWTLKYAIV